MGAVEAIEALAARRDRADDDALPDRILVVEAAPERLDDADRFVAKHEARQHGILTADDMYIPPADRRRRAPNHRLTPPRRWLRQFLERDPVLLLEYDGSHGVHGSGRLQVQDPRPTP